jgi:spore maturation protein CgeB
VRILFVGYLGRGQTSGMRCEALRRLGHDVASVDVGSVWRGASYPSRQLQQLTLHGPRIDALNAAVLNAADLHRPNLVWAEKQEYLRPATLKRLGLDGAATLHYTPDPYFSLSWKRTSLTDECLPLYDVVVVTKRYELQSYASHGCSHVIYSPLGYDPVGHAPPAHSSGYSRDVVFVGGWEPRRERLLAAAKQAAKSVSIWGYGWSIALEPRTNPLRALRLGRLAPAHRVYLGKPSAHLEPAIQAGEGRNGEIYEEAYSRAIAGSRIALGLLREVCPDQHTTRTFEIPAIGGFMLADRSQEHMEFFEEGLEAEFFGSDDEYLDKLKFYLANEEVRGRVARAGHERCMRSGYSYDDRIRCVIADIAR